MPTISCSAIFCNNNRYNVKKRQVDVTFHSFPINDELCRKWINFCKQDKNWKPTKNSAVCSVHFKKEDYQLAKSPLVKSNKNLRRLHLHAVPSLRRSVVLEISTKKKIDEKISKTLTKELYSHDGIPCTETDHSYSDSMAEINAKGSRGGMKKNLYRLQNFPAVCICCLKPIHDPNQFTRISYYDESLECTIEQKLDELSGDPMGREDIGVAPSLLPNKICENCLNALIAFHKYQRQIECIRSFNAGIAQLLSGNQEPLHELYENKGVYLLNCLKSLHIYHGSQRMPCLKTIVQEIASYERLRKIAESRPKPTMQRTSNQSKPKENFTSVDTGVSDSDDDYDMDREIGLCSDTKKSLVYGNENIHSAVKIRPVPHSIIQLDEEWIDLENFSKSEDEFETDGVSCPYETICTKRFQNEQDKDKHVSEDHTSFVCNICNTKVRFYDLYNKHMDSHAIARELLLSHNSKSDEAKKPSKDSRCNFCGMDFPSDDLLSDHRQTHRSRRSYVCGTCLGVYYNEKEFKVHDCNLVKKGSKPPKDTLPKQSRTTQDRSTS